MLLCEFCLNRFIQTFSCFKTEHFKQNKILLKMWGVHVIVCFCACVCIFVQNL